LKSKIYFDYFSVPKKHKTTKGLKNIFKNIKGPENIGN